MIPHKPWAILCAALCLTTSTARAAETAPAPQQVTIRQVEVKGNTLLPQADLERATASLLGSKTIAELQAAAAAVQALYNQAGYGAVIAFLPEQQLDTGTLLITVVEGKLARVVVSGNRQFSTENVRRSLPSLIDGQTPRVREIDTQIQFANENPARQLAITLEEGQQPGQVDARVIVTETPVQRYKLSLDDTGNNQTGRTRLNAAYQNTALSERDDQLVAQLQLSPEKLSAVRVFSAAYRLPLYSAGLMLQAYGSYSNVEAAGTATAAGDLRFAGKGRLLGLQLTHHLQRLGEFEQRISVAADKRDYLNDCAIQGLPSGACGSAGASVTVHPLTLSYDNLRRGARPAGVTLSVATNLALGGSHGSSADFDAVRSDAKRRYSVLFGSGFGSRAFADDWQIAYRAFVQLTRDALVPGERFGLTSVGVVRGYEEREVTGDSAVAGSLELYTPVIRSAAVGDGEFAFGDMRLMTFVDAGEVRNHAGLNCNLVDTRCRLSAIGVGARFALGRSQWRLDLARANSNARETASGDLRLHFQASVVYP